MTVRTALLVLGFVLVLAGVVLLAVDVGSVSPAELDRMVNDDGLG